MPLKHVSEAKSEPDPGKSWSGRNAGKIIYPKDLLEEYYPPGVTSIWCTGGSHFIGLIDEKTVLKYSHTPHDEHSIDIETSMYEAIGPHPRILEFKGRRDDGILLAYAKQGSLRDYLKSHPGLEPATTRKFAIQASEAVAHIHRHNVLHCDLRPANFLLTENLDLLLCDFEGRLLRPDGSVDKNGNVRENAKSRMPGTAIGEASIKTDIFALGTIIFQILLGHEPFPDLHSVCDQEAIATNFASHSFPEIGAHQGRDVIVKCWRGEYASADEVVRDLKDLKESSRDRVV